MRKLCGFVLSIISIAAAMPVNAQESGIRTVGDLRKSCAYWNVGGRTLAQETDTVRCYAIFEGYIIGFIVGHLRATTKLNHPDPLNYMAWCPHGGASIEQFIADFMQWADRNPTKRQAHYLANLLAAFEKAWPCKK